MGYNCFVNEVLKQKIQVLPKNSGVYVMRDKSNNVIYVGKAKNLKNRVGGYFQNSIKHEKVQLMVDSIEDMEYFVVPSEYDAFVLERNLIAKYQPFFNILLKDGKQYPYLKFDLSKKFPRLEVARRVKGDHAKYFGPYLYPVRAEELINIVNYAFPLRTCTMAINQGKPKSRGCLNFDLGLCSAPCANKITEKDYMEIVKKVSKFLGGDSSEMLKILNEKMRFAAETENFETALELKNKIAMVEKLDSKVITQLPNTASFDVLGCFCDGIFMSTCVMQIRGGRLLGVECFNLVNFSENTREVMQNFVVDFYSQQVIPAKEILVGMDLSNKVLEEFFETQKNVKVNFVFVQKGIKKKLVEMANLNAQKYVERTIQSENRKNARTFGAITRLKSALGLRELPVRMECYDISHLSGTEKVGSMVVFVNGEKKTKLYRKFRIRTVEGIDDFASLQEVLSRRVEEYKKQKDVSFSQKPNLIIIDGGKGQLHYSYQQTQKLGFDVEMISLAKKFEEVFVVGDSTPHMLKRGSVELGMLQQIRDEAHRFAITFNRESRLKSAFKSPLLEVEGIGTKTAQNLIQKFGTVAKMKKATKEEIAKVSGVNKNNLNNLLKYLEINEN